VDTTLLCRALRLGRAVVVRIPPAAQDTLALRPGSLLVWSIAGGVLSYTPVRLARAAPPPAAAAKKRGESNA